MKNITLILIFIFVLVATTAAITIDSTRLLAQENLPPNRQIVRERMLADRQAPEDMTINDTIDAATPCLAGMAGIYPCANIDLLANVPLNKMDASDGNDIWGWTDPSSGREFALVGLDNGLAFVEISDPVDPLYLGKLPTHSSNRIWRDVKVYRNHAFVVSEAPAHGLQIIDLTELLNVPSPPKTFSETKHYDQFGSAHNIAINEASGYAYVVGAGSCSGGLHMIDIQNPIDPQFAGCFSEDGYTHDTQCVIYQGPDTSYQGSEVCFSANEDTLTIADVTNKNNPVQLAREGYAGSSYTHQGWLTEDHQYFLLGDELDEAHNGHNTRTYIWDVSDLQAPKVIGTFTGPTPAIDHNLYIQNDLVYQANYSSGLRILDANLISQGKLAEVAYFETYPTSNSASYNGAWSVYPFFTSGNIIVSDIERGLFVLKHVQSQLRYLPMIR
ncbi:MAG: choice-of-anchor B family protein [Candidatus Promineifilaceae bacterium]|nr:choice-of-anchor B family protein [Candidatus Promineifilaceae bacterium]